MSKYRTGGLLPSPGYPPLTCDNCDRLRAELDALKAELDLLHKVRSMHMCPPRRACPECAAYNAWKRQQEGGRDEHC